MKRLIGLFAIAVAALAGGVSPASAAFGIKEADVTFTGGGSSSGLQAGGHPAGWTTYIAMNEAVDPLTGDVEPDGGEVKDLFFEFPPGLVANPGAVPTCSQADFLTGETTAACPDATVIGIAEVMAANHPIPSGAEQFVPVPIYNLDPSPRTVAKIGFYVVGVPVVVDAVVSQNPPYNVIAVASNVSQAAIFFRARTTLWGDPASPVHDTERGPCAMSPNGTCPVNIPRNAFTTVPRSCTGPLTTVFRAASWLDSAATVVVDSMSHPAMEGCSRLGLSLSTEVQPTTHSAGSPSGLAFDLNVKDEGLVSPEGIAGSDIKKAEVILPEGMTVNPSQAEGLAGCSEADFARETATSEFGTGCPGASKVGTVEVETPLLEGKILRGSLFVAAPFENPFHSLIGLYMTIKEPQLGISVNLAGKVVPDPLTGRLITTFGEPGHELPQLPYSHFRLRFREGGRSPLSTPSTCGGYATRALFTPWANPGITNEVTSTFQVTSGVRGGPCPPQATPPFHPGLIAGTVNNAARSYSPFDLRLTREDGEQEFTNFSIKLPPGVTGKLAGIPFCSDLQIAAAKAREGTPHGGQEEIDRPSCPGDSQIGRTLVGAGVGPELTYVPGKVYLAGPYHGSNLSIVAITAAKAGPFDLGTVVIREALRVDPETAEVFVDATGSDPIPHIIGGIPVHARDIRAYVDRPEFVLNPTSCEPTSTASTVLGSGADFAGSPDDVPVTVTSRFQAADCASLNYRPRLSLRLRGGTRRGKNPQLTAILRPRPGDANSKRISVALPHSEFLDQSHIKTICTRVQFKAGAGNGVECPKGSIYGYVRAWTPLLDNPLQGNVYLRSSEHPLPDLVLALHGQIEFTSVGRIDSHKGGIRNTFEAVPDAPISKVEVRFQGGKKGLLINSTNICRGKHRASLEYIAHSGKRYDAKAPLRARACRKHRKAKKHRKGHAHRHHRKRGAKRAGRR